MPKSEHADLIVNSIGYQQTIIPLEFKDNPTYHENVVPTTAEKQPPTVEIESSKSNYSPGTTVYITAKGSDTNKRITIIEITITHNTIRFLIPVNSTTI